MNIIHKLEYYSKDDIYDRLFSLPEVDDEILAQRIVDALSILETKLIDRISEKIIFCSLHKNTYGVMLNHRSIRYRNKGFIILNPKIMRFKVEKQLKIILHEVAHGILNHKTIQDYFNAGGDELYDNNERLADRLVEKWISQKKIILSTNENKR